MASSLSLATANYPNPIILSLSKDAWEHNVTDGTLRQAQRDGVYSLIQNTVSSGGFIGR